MPSAKISSYSVGVVRRSNDLINRFITCIPESTDDGRDYDSFVIYFLPDRESIGYEDGRTVVGFLAPDDFRDVYHVLQTESPVYINWSVKAKQSLHYLSIGTRQEPPGEGFEDRSD